MQCQIFIFLAQNPITSNDLPILLYTQQEVLQTRIFIFIYHEKFFQNGNFQITMKYVCITYHDTITDFNE